MSDIIHLLSDAVANQIAAGEVIQRPASVIKELVENALDAGSTEISVVVKGAGRTSIQVIDNGKGMSPTDARLAFERHATSKIQDANDLFNLTTMGFRGEALASIAAVAQVELRTRRSDDELGTQIEIAASSVQKQEAIHCSFGTSFMVKNLFFNVPARRKFLKSDDTEMRQIMYEFQRIALANPQVAMFLYNGDDLVYDLQVGSFRQRIAAIFGKKIRNFAQQLVQIEVKTSLVDIYGFVGKPEFATKNANQFFFVNSRFMKHPYFHKAVISAYNQMLQVEMSPNYFIYLNVDPTAIDVNIHPTKTEIKFENEREIWSILMIAVKEALGKFNVVPSIDFDTQGMIDIPVSSSETTSEMPKVSFDPTYNPFNMSSSTNSATASRGYSKPISHPWEELYRGFEQEMQDEFEGVVATGYIDVAPKGAILASNLAVPAEETSTQLFNDEAEASSDFFSFRQRYLFTSVKSGLMVIDQSRAWYRIQFEKILGQLKQQKGITQQLLFPEQFSLTSDDMVLMRQLEPDLRTLGFDLEPFGKSGYAINGVPAMLTHENDITAILDSILMTAKNEASEVGESLRISLAKSLAQVVARQKVVNASKQEMEQLVDKLFGCDTPNLTPDGKTIVKIITEEELPKLLGIQ